MRNTILSLTQIAPLRQTVLEDFDRYMEICGLHRKSCVVFSLYPSP